jgi:hypothetical protein
MKLVFDAGIVEGMEALGLVAEPAVDAGGPQPTMAACSDAELREVIRAEATMRAALATQLRAIAEAEHRGLCAEAGARRDRGMSATTRPTRFSWAFMGSAPVGRFRSVIAG